MKKKINKKIIILLSVLILLVVSAFLIYDYYHKKPRIISIFFTEGTDMQKRKEIVNSFGGELYNCQYEIAACDIVIPKNLEFPKLQELLKDNPNVRRIDNEPFGYPEVPF